MVIPSYKVVVERTLPIGLAKLGSESQVCHLPSSMTLSKLLNLILHLYFFCIITYGTPNNLLGVRINTFIVQMKKLKS